MLYADASLSGDKWGGYLSDWLSRELNRRVTWGYVNNASLWHRAACQSGIYQRSHHANIFRIGQPVFHAGLSRPYPCRILTLTYSHISKVEIAADINALKAITISSKLSIATSPSPLICTWSATNLPIHPSGNRKKTIKNISAKIKIFIWSHTC